MASLYGNLLARGWWLLLLVFVAAAVFSALQLRKLGIEFQTRTLLDQHDKDFEKFQQKHETGTWSETEFAVVCLSGRDWVSEEGVATLRQVVEEIEALPNSDATFSLIDIPLLRQQPDEKPNLFALAGGMKYLRDDKPTNWEAARAELLDHELAAGTLVSRDGRHINVLVYLKPAAPGAPDAQTRWQELVPHLRDLADRWSHKLSERVKLAGVPVVYSYIIDRVAHDLRVFGIAAALLFSLGLFVVYRKPELVLLPLVSSVLPVLFILAYMALAGIRFTVITSNLPLLLFVLTLPFTIYLSEVYLERRSAHHDESHLDSIVRAAKVLWTPIFFSALTMIAGFLAFATSGIIPVRYFGILMAAGAAVAVAVVFLFYAAALRGWARSADKRRLESSSQGRPASASSRTGLHLASWFGKLALARPAGVVVASGVIFLAATAGAFRLTAENKFTSYFWPSSEVYRDLEFIDRNLGGTSTLEIYLSSAQEGFFKTGEGLNAVAAVESFFSTVPEKGSLRTLTSLTREARKAFRKEWFPELQDEFVLTLVQSTAPELFREIMSQDGREASLQVRLQETAPTLNRQRILAALNKHIDALRDKELKGLTVEKTGIFVLYANMLETLIVSQKETLGFVIAAIYLMLLILFRSPVLALLVLLPQALPAVTILGIMGWFHIPLDLVTVMIAAIAIGVGVDSAIQYTVRFRQELEIDGDLRAALSRSHATIGRAIWIATTVIVLGFGVLVFSDFFPSVWFGLFTGLAMLMSQFSALITLPAIFLVTGYPKMAR